MQEKTSRATDLDVEKATTAPSSSCRGELKVADLRQFAAVLRFLLPSSNCNAMHYRAEGKKKSK